MRWVLVILWLTALGGAVSSRGEAPVADDFRLTSLIEAEAGGEAEREAVVMAGVLDHRQDPPRSYLLVARQRQGDLELLSIDYTNSLAQVRIGGEQIVWLSLSGTGARPVSQAARVSAGSEPADKRLTPDERERRAFGLAPVGDAAAERGGEEAASPPTAQRRLTPADLQRRIHDVQMAHIRSRGADQPLMPIPLTAELEADMRRAGVVFPD